MADLRDFLGDKGKGNKEKKGSSSNVLVGNKEVFLTDVSAFTLGDDKERKRISISLKTPNLFVYRDLLNREFVKDEEIEFMVSISNGGKERITGFFQRVPIFDILFFGNKEDWEVQNKNFREKVSKGSFFAFSRTHYSLFTGTVGISEEKNMVQLLKQVSELVPIVYFPFASWDRLCNVGFVKKESKSYLKLIESLPERIEEPNLVLVLSKEDEERLVAAFKERMKEYVNEIENAVASLMKTREYVLVTMEKSTDEYPSWEFAFLNRDVFQKKVFPILKKNSTSLNDVEELIDEMIVMEDFFTDLVFLLKDKYPQPYFYSGWLTTIINALMFEPLEEIFNFVYKKYFSMLFSGAVIFAKLYDDIVRKKFVMVYSKDTIYNFSMHYFESIKTKKQTIFERYENYKKTLDSILEIL